MGFLDSLWDSAADKVTKMFSHSLATNVEPMEKRVVNGLLVPIYDLVGMPKPPYSHLSEQEKRQIFDKWMTKHGKTYKNNHEKELRFTNFLKRMISIERVCRNESVWRNVEDCLFGLDVTSDFTMQEFARRNGHSYD